MASEKGQTQAIRYEQEKIWDRIKRKTGKRAVGAIATATAAASIVLPLSACGEQSSGGGYDVPTASAEATPEHWTLDEVAFDEYMASLPSKAEQAEASKIPLGLSDAELGQAVADRLCSAINFGIESELRDIFNQGDINNDLDKSLREAEIEKRATEIAKRNNILGSIVVDVFPNVTTYTEEYIGKVKNINKNSIGKYTYDQDSKQSICTPVAIHTTKRYDGSGRSVMLLYNNEGGMNKTDLKDGEVDLPGVGKGNGFIEFLTDETGNPTITYYGMTVDNPNRSTAIIGVEKGKFFTVNPDEWHVYQ